MIVDVVVTHLYFDCSFVAVWVVVEMRLNSKKCGLDTEPEQIAAIVDFAAVIVGFVVVAVVQKFGYAESQQADSEVPFVVVNSSVAVAADSFEFFAMVDCSFGPCCFYSFFSLANFSNWVFSLYYNFS